MVRSMTGYGRDVISFNNSTITVEIRSVNHRFLDISTKIPRYLIDIEEDMKKMMKNYFLRGRFDVFITIDGEGFVERNLVINWSLMDQYISHLREIKRRYQLAGEIPVDTVTQIEDLFTIQETEQESDSLKQAILTAIENASQQVLEMREKEGNELVKDLRTRIELINSTVKKLGERRDIVIIEYRERILNRLEQYLKEELRSDESKIYQDVAVLVEKGDITEEVTRIDSHINQFLDTIKQQGAIGRKLDFILQEMLREINTIGSKSNDVLISQYVVTIKSEIEKVKEQIQNVE
ncbi:YicC/YloC family endoribonuclease [Aquibacillus albus]|uniref:Uncharacterized protein (TIGR00255 family) n=1 Tax=Aquibacillus albus TaxID=1168171 RepID=A0ABS2N0X4_9BACI|nr:YicC/YloC family endoribonuclease [Aquibacillus albus]MBM7571767.1 uncharacterized protein (TIGR00255 family) [Aquibacillus albus]